MWKEWKTEWIKVRYRGIGLLLLAFLGMSFFWILWSLTDASRQQIQDGYRMLFLQLPLIDTILMPTMLAMLGSRLCDAEVKGNTLKLLCTMEKKGRLFDMKLFMGTAYLVFFVAAQVGMILALGRIFGFERPVEFIQLVCFVVEVFPVSLAILLLQQVLSLFFENQIFPLAAGLFGSFVGLFSWFFPGQPFRKLFLWSYYALLGFINYDWNETTRIITYYDVPMDIPSLILLLLILILGYGLGKMLFVRREL